MLTYLLAQVMEQNLLVPLNWLAGATLLQYSHFSTEGGGGGGWNKNNNNRADGKHVISIISFTLNGGTRRTSFKLLQGFKRAWPLPVAVVTASDWLASGPLPVRVASFTDPHTCQSNKITQLTARRRIGDYLSVKRSMTSETTNPRHSQGKAPPPPGWRSPRWGASGRWVSPRLEGEELSRPGTAHGTLSAWGRGRRRRRGEEQRGLVAWGSK